MILCYLIIVNYNIVLCMWSDYGDEYDKIYIKLVI